MADEPIDERLEQAEEAIEEAKEAERDIPDAALPEDLRTPDYFGHLKTPEVSDEEAWDKLEPDATDFEPDQPGEPA
ncbi:hypothetical protein [Propioniciclava sp.]|uniref:hypothetical protein n=1 Tax=Propioniciclava sp. TaxID=2038686 RepID=UPI0026041932|nr:hypothetical protein [Propioniciclava sp.]